MSHPRCNYCGAPQTKPAPADPAKERCGSCGQGNPRAAKRMVRTPSRHLNLDVIERTPLDA